MLLPWLGAFLFTQCVEIPIYVALAKVRPLEAFGASALTHPIVWFVIPHLGWGSYPRMVVAAETFAVVAEALYLTVGFQVKRSMAWALIANLASVSLGFFSRWAFGWP